MWMDTDFKEKWREGGTGEDWSGYVHIDVHNIFSLGFSNQHN